MKSLERVIKVALVTFVTAANGVGGLAIACNAPTSEDVSKRSIEELDDVALHALGVSFEDFSGCGFGTPEICGASQFSVGQMEQNVSTLMAGVNIPRQYALDVETMDMGRIEVVKGPQSVL